MELSKAISAILFYRAEPMSIKSLSVLLKCSEGEIRDALSVLDGVFAATGIRMVMNGNEVTMGTAPETSALIESITKEELSRDLSRASLETLAIVLYGGPITRSGVDYIRGVNSTFILRNLLVRGLIEKCDNPDDQRSFLYKSTFQALEFMGVTRPEELPDYHDALTTLANFSANKDEVEACAEMSASTSEDDNVNDDNDQAVNSSVPSNTPSQEDGPVGSEEESNEAADIAENDEIGSGFDDSELAKHTEIDRNEEES